MKNTIGIVIIFLYSISASAQIFGNDPEIKVDGLAPESVWQIAEMAMNENSIPLGKFSPNESILMSDWIEWTSIAIKNHAHLYIKYEAPSIILKIADRQYASSEGWSEAVGNLSKKNYKKYVQSVANRIEEIKEDPALTKKAVKTSKLIPAFNAVNQVGDLEWKLLSFKQNEQTQPEFELEITNKGSKAAKVKIIELGFHSNDLKSSAGCKYKWQQAIQDDYKSTVIAAGATTKSTCRVAPGYHLKSTVNAHLFTKYSENGDVKNMKEFKIYAIPTPYTYHEGD